MSLNEKKTFPMRKSIKQKKKNKLLSREPLPKYSPYRNEILTK